MSKKMASKEDVSFLEECGVAVPPSAAAAASLVKFIKIGNGTLGYNPEERVALTKKYQAMYEGKKIFNNAEDTGTIEYLIARSRDEIYKKVDIIIGNSRPLPPSPFVAMVRWDHRKGLYKTSLYSFTVAH